MLVYIIWKGYNLDRNLVAYIYVDWNARKDVKNVQGIREEL